MVTAGAQVVGCNGCLGEKVWRAGERTRSSWTVAQYLTTGAFQS